ncbi:MAG: hypothetical protein ABEH64_01050 [Salinirussus sp.]
MLSADELAGVVDLFGALTRAELRSAAAELAFKRSGEFDPESFGTAVDDAVRSYHLLDVPSRAVDGEATVNEDAPEWVIPGPAAFPELPTHGADLPHILDIGHRAVDHDVAVRHAEERFRADAAAAVDAGDGDRITTLRDVSYELETWGGLDLTAARARFEE